jgi:alkaline phosphatase D
MCCAAVVSQSIFTAMATTHGPGRERLRADYDTNAWPQTARNAALREIRKAFAFHIAGDQHLPAVVHYGIDAPGDAAVAFAGPAVNNLYPRWWEPERPGRNRPKGGDLKLGDFTDSFGHPLTVRAVANPALAFRKGVLEVEQDKAAGLGIVRFDKKKRTITIECWPFLADPSRPGTQFPGWPVSVSQLENYGRRPVAYLPRLMVRDTQDPVVQVIDESSGEIIYTLRIAGHEFTPPVFAPGRYQVVVSDPDAGRMKEVRANAAQAGNSQSLEIELNTFTGSIP